MKLLTNTILSPLLVQRKSIRIEPFEPSMLQHTCYYLRLGERIDTKQGNQWIRRATSHRSMVVEPRSFVRVWTCESIALSTDIFAVFGQVSDLIEQGLLLVHSPFIDPLFTGYLRLGLHNLTDEPVALRVGQPLAKVSFFEVAESQVTAPTKGSLMDSKLQTFREYVERMDVPPFPPESLEDED